MTKGILVKTTAVDYPGKLACTYFLQGCNLRCPYCFNKELVNSSVEKEDLVDVEELYKHLEKRKNVLSGLVLSGGEALLNKDIASVIKKAKGFGYEIKLDTNGLSPDVLERLLHDKESAPDFIALDIKTSPNRYEILTGKHNLEEREKELLKIKIEATIKILAALPCTKREFRTVLVPPLINEEDILTIATLLPKDASWQFAPFRAENCLDPAYNKIIPYSDKKMNELVNIAQKTIENACLR